MIPLIRLIRTAPATVLCMALIAFAFNPEIYASQNQNSESSGIQLLTVVAGGIPSAFIGQSVSANADINGDGTNDLIVGSNGNGGKRQGTVHIFYRNKFERLSELSTAETVITGEERMDQFGWAVTTEGDLNGDGNNDLAVSAIKRSGIGKVYVFLGGKSLPEKVSAQNADYIISSTDSSETFGFVLCADGDLNGDGIHDLAVSAPSNSEGAEEAGKVYVFNGGGWGRRMTTADAACEIPGESYHSSFGSSISFGGDVTGNGIDDLAVGAFFSSMDSSNAGRVYLFSGRNVWPQKMFAAQADVVIKGFHKESWLGTAVEIIGDINRDGLSELIAGASGEFVKGDDSGAAYLFHGGMKSGPVSVLDAGLNMVSSRIGNNFGTNIVRTGDIDGDGREDWIITEPGGLIAQKEAKGRVYLFLTSMSGRSDIASVIEEPVARNNFGCAVSAGDINGDGFCEIVVGANWDNTAGEKSGKVVIFTVRP